ncbi:hypothetical protein JTE90_026542 [Oedothorax gibbosus]|uniref:Uncharacterized protein n=1 Tax=Oedothorax gibbosus TaxID=931172 RepID=A0AAV6VSC8_9ARAC|nr:hypothetical protein JTE90_026542 [Oedothorax gibbosus]
MMATRLLHLSFAMFPLIVAPPHKTQVEGDESGIDGLAMKVGGMEKEIGGVQTKSGGVVTKIGGFMTEIGRADPENVGQETKIEIEPTIETEKTENVTAGYNTTDYYVNRNPEFGHVELQQVSDNMTTRQQFVTSPRESVTLRTEHLLGEAHDLLNNIQSNEKRLFLQGFAHLLENMHNVVNPGRMVKRNASAIENLMQQYDEKEYKLQDDVDKKPTLADDLPPSTVSSLPQSTEDGSVTNSITALYHTVHDVDSHQVDHVATDAQPSVPSFTQGVPIQIEQEVTTTTTILFTQNNNGNQSYAEDDELVRELHELPRLAALEWARAQSTQAPSENPTDSLSPRTIKRNLMEENGNNKKEENGNYEMTLEDEARELRLMGATLDEISIALGLNRLQLAGMQESDKKGKEAGIHDSHNINSDETTTHKINPNTWKPFPHPYIQPNSNATFRRIHTNLPQVNVAAHQYQGGHRLRPHYPRKHKSPRNIQNMLHKLQRENYLLKKHLMAFTQPNGNVNKLRSINYPGPKPLNSFLPHEVRYPTEFSLNTKIQSQRNIPEIHPYPNIMNSDLKNVTLKENVDKASPLIPKPLPQKTGSEFTDEMKRELRDGKVILLSDSVVRSNFNNEKDIDGGKKEDEKSSSEVGKGQN